MPLQRKQLGRKTARWLYFLAHFIVWFSVMVGIAIEYWCFTELLKR